MEKNAQTIAPEGSIIETEETDGQSTAGVVAPITCTRGIRACLKDGWRIFALNAGPYLRSLSWPALVAGAGVMFPVWLLVRFYAQHIAPALLYLESGLSRAEVWHVFRPQLDDYLLFAVSVVIAAVCYSLFRGALWLQFATYAERNQLSARAWLGAGALWRYSLRHFVFNLIVAAVMLVLIVVGGAIAFFTQIHYLALLLVPLLLIVQTLFMAGRYSYLMGQSLGTSLTTDSRVGFRHFGGYFVLLLLTAMPLMASGLILAMPYATFPLSFAADAVNLATENPTGIPGYVPAISFIAGTVALAIQFLLASMQTWVLNFKIATDIQLVKTAP